ncbi:MAG TPA: nucleotidyltransferase domain-containing protein [Micromonosporaceae bacterium]|nr:nucleotidyltransferase domain-containing protein [Micromonosporaceae bacterium]
MGILIDNGRVSGNRELTNPRWAVAEAIAAGVLRRYSSQIHAIGVHGSMAHGDDEETSGVDLAVVTGQPGGGPSPTRRRISGVLVVLDVISVPEYLAMAATLTPSWPLTADRYLTTRPIYDPMGWHGRLRDTHLGRLAEATRAQFAAPARQAWCQAAAARDRAVRLAQWHDTDGALLAVGEARLATALVHGLLTRTYYRSGADALGRTGLGDIDLVDLSTRLAELATELGNRGHPVDGQVNDLFD